MYHDEKSPMSNMSQKQSFALGLVGGVMVLCTIGFFILLGIMLKGGDLSLSKGGGNYAKVPAPSAAPSAAAPDAPEPVGEVKPIGKDDYVRGDKNAKVTLYEWSDYECPFCSRFHPTMVQLLNEYEGKVNWVYRHFPLSFHQQAVPAANAAECAGEQGKFWEYSDELFANTSLLSDSYYGQLADELKLNKSKFDSCYSSKKYGAKVSQQMADGSASGVTGTPGTIIVSKSGYKQLVAGAVPYEQLKAMVDAALAE